MSLKIIAWPKCKNRKRNPYQSLLYGAVEALPNMEVEEFTPVKMLSTSGKVVLHVHWPDVFLDSAIGWKFWLKLFFLRGVFLIAKIRKMPIIWTAHNLKRVGQRHGNKLDRYFWPWFGKKVDGIIYMTEASKCVAEASFKNWKNIPNVVIPHGHYKPIFENLEFIKPRANSSADYLPEILFFGSITKYKNVYKLLEAFLELPPGNSRLSIKGELSSNSPDTRLTEILSKLPKERKEEVEFQNRFLDDHELVQAITDCDLVVFPYSDVLNSGAAIFALSVGRPILASNTALFRELQSLVGEDWVYLIDGELDKSTLLNGLNRAKALNTAKRKPDLSKFEWSTIAEQSTDFYQQLIAEREK